MGPAVEGDWQANLEVGARHTRVARAWRGDAGEGSSMTVSSVDKDRMAAEQRLLAEQLIPNGLVGVA